MSLISKIRKGEGPVWSRVKNCAKAVLQFHIPAGGPLKYLFKGLYLLHKSVGEFLIWFVRFFWYEPLFRSQCERVGSGFQMEKLPYLTGSGRILIGKNVSFSGKPSIGFTTAVESEPTLEIGDETFIGHQTSFAIGRRITIGKNCLIAGGVTIRDYDGHPLDAEERRILRKVIAEEIRPVVIGDDCWIGGRALILKGVTIGSRSIVAARSVVTKDVPPDVIVAGNPARVVKSLHKEIDSSGESRDSIRTLEE